MVIMNAIYKEKLVNYCVDIVDKFHVQYNVERLYKTNTS